MLRISKKKKRKEKSRLDCVYERFGTTFDVYFDVFEWIEVRFFDF